ncbi:MAG: S1C family serine protease, partial [Candidatus Dormibacteraceae bacterium]
PDDLSVVHVDAAHLTLATLADSAKLQGGDIVLAVGNPLGLQSRITRGIVSGLGRTVSEPNGVTLPDPIQTSAAINPGNSGEPWSTSPGRWSGSRRWPPWTGSSAVQPRHRLRDLVEHGARPRPAVDRAPAGRELS